LTNEYQEYFLGDKSGRCVGLTLPPSCADCLEIWEPQHPGTLKACPETASISSFAFMFPKIKINDFRSYKQKQLLIQ
jgi:hypothetical protein